MGEGSEGLFSPPEKGDRRFDLWHLQPSVDHKDDDDYDDKGDSRRWRSVISGGEEVPPVYVPPSVVGEEDSGGPRRRLLVADLAFLGCCFRWRDILHGSKMLSPASTCTGTLWKYYEKLKDATNERKP